MPVLTLWPLNASQVDGSKDVKRVEEDEGDGAGFAGINKSDIEAAENALSTPPPPLVMPTTPPAEEEGDGGGVDVGGGGGGGGGEGEGADVGGCGGGGGGGGGGGQKAKGVGGYSVSLQELEQRLLVIIDKQKKAPKGESKDVRTFERGARGASDRSC